MKYTLTITLLLSAIFSNGQFKVKQPRDIQHSYLFSTDNPKGKGHIDWGFHDSVVYKDIVIGGSVLQTGKVIKSERFKTQKPFIFMDSAGVVVYMYETERGIYSILYSDITQDLTTLVIGGFGDKMKEYPIYGVVHFW